MQRIVQYQRKEETTQIVLDSTEISQMLDVGHDQILRKLEGAKDRKGIIEVLTNNQMVVSDYFIKSSYKDESGKENKCYLFTKMGCEFIANKFTGEKGILFTAKYVKRFNEMEQTLQSGQASLNELSPQLQLLINMELEQKQIKEQLNQVNNNALQANHAAEEAKKELQGIRDIIQLNPNSWRTDSKTIIIKIAHKLGGNNYINEVNKEIYALLNTRMGANIEQRLTNKRRRMAEEGICKSKRDKTNKLDVIADDKKLIEGYIAIVKELAIKYGVGV